VVNKEIDAKPIGQNNDRYLKFPDTIIEIETKGNQAIFSKDGSVVKDHHGNQSKRTKVTRMTTNLNKVSWISNH